MRHAALFVAVCLAFAPAAFSADPGQPVPASELARSIQVPYEAFTLDNGLRVVVHTDRKAPVVAVQAWYNVGSKDEPRGRTGFAHLFEHIGLFNPTENLPGGLMVPLRDIGATDWNGTTWFDRTNFFQTVPTSALEQALYMESDRMGHLLGALNQERLDNQRGVVQNEKRQGDNQPYGMVEYAQLETLFPEGHPYRHSTIGSMADLDAATLEDLRQWHRDKYGPNNAVLALVGDIDVKTARRLAQKYFGHIPRGPDNVPAAAGIPTLPARVDLTLHDRVATTRLYRTWVVPGTLDKETAPIDIAATVLGGLDSSRLQEALVRRDQVAVAASASYLPFHRLGLFEVTVDVKPGEDAEAVGRQLDALIADFVAQGPDAMDRTVVQLGIVSPNLAPGLELLADVVRNPSFKPEDLERVRGQQLAAIEQERSSPNGMGRRALPALIYGASHPYGRPFSGLGHAKAVEALDRDDLVAFHQRWLRPDNARIFVVSDRPLSEIRPLLEQRFGDWKAPAVEKGRKDFDVGIPKPQPRIVLIDRPQSPQSLILGAVVLPVSGRDDLTAFNAANEVIGNGFLSRINQDIRETRGWSYGLNGRITLTEQRSPYIVTAPVQANRTGESVQVLIDQYRDFLGDKGVTAAERERTINGSVRSLPGGFETSAAVMDALRGNALYGRPDNYWETLGPKYEALSAADMDAAARRIIRNDDLVWVVVGDAETVKPQLENLGLPLETRPAE